MKQIAKRDASLWFIVFFFDPEDGGDMFLRNAI
jgi:hypothetical protein